MWTYKNAKILPRDGLLIEMFLFSREQRKPKVKRSLV